MQEIGEEVAADRGNHFLPGGVDERFVSKHRVRVGAARSSTDEQDRDNRRRKERQPLHSQSRATAGPRERQ
jgi:hypothetical protein